MNEYRVGFSAEDICRIIELRDKVFGEYENLIGAGGSSCVMDSSLESRKETFMTAVKEYETMVPEEVIKALTPNLDEWKEEFSERPARFS